MAQISRHKLLLLHLPGREWGEVASAVCLLCPLGAQLPGPMDVSPHTSSQARCDPLSTRKKE